uniref:NADH-ubiquinone oxidoreductase chain 5 n=1 Tax=Ptiliidae sp. BMNH 1274724 TaxID=1796537 RepID=A0A126TEH0_9COLE|nr:NADH dehydrogenase subunit 5 [Ptiliidae sp. BMNH 1274724]
MILSLMNFILSLYFLVNDKSLILELELININSVLVLMTILLDWMSLLFLSFVLFISSLVILYSEDYMKSDKFNIRFLYLVLLFVLSMMFMIMSPNLLSILLGWDGLGLISYLLVIYYQNYKSYSAGMLTALINRLGDVALLMAIAWMMNYGSWNYIYYIFSKYDYFMNMIVFFVILASFTKSAQIPFSSWLPAAMAAPTPVSSLVHSSTLVTAGIYLLIRFNYSLDYKICNYLLFISSLTMFMAGIGANFEFDLKKIIALSTLSQLGLMMSILFIGSFELAFFHLLVHALFKALLFMCAGNIIHNMLNYQDIRFMGGLIKFIPLTLTFFNISNLSLCGFPFLSGFYSKDLILELFSMNYINLYMYMMFYISIGLTVSYSLRLMYYLMIMEFKFLNFYLMGEFELNMLFSMMFLMMIVIFSGSFLMWIMFLTPIFIYLSILMKFMTMIFIFMGIYLGYYISYMNLKMSKMNLFFMSMWYMPYLFSMGVVNFPLNFSLKIYKKLDQGWEEFYSGFFVNKNLNYMSLNFYKYMYMNYKMFMFLLILLLL